MTIFRTEHKKNYTTVNNYISKDKRISWKAKGIWLYAFSRPDDWEFHLNDIINQSTDKRDKVLAGLKELENAGYLIRNQDRNKGKFSKVEWVFYETPQKLKKCLPETDFPLTENPPLLNTDSNKEEEEENFSTKKEFDKKMQLLNEVPLTQNEKMLFVRESLATIERSVAEFCRDRAKVTDPIQAFRLMIKGQWKTYDDSKIHTEPRKSQKDKLVDLAKDEMLSSLKVVVKALYDMYPEKVGYQKNEKGGDLWINSHYFEVVLKELTHEKCRLIATFITNHLQESTQIVYNQMQGNNKFEVLVK